MNAPTIARILGLLFIILAAAGFVPWVSPKAPEDAPVITLDMAYRYIAGVFPVNVAHDAVHLLFGVWGLLAASRFGWAVGYCRTVAWVYLLLFILGVVPFFAFYTLFGIAPIFGWDSLLHLVLALLGAYGGFGRASLEVEAPTP